MTANKNPRRKYRLEDIELKSGAHTRASEGMCMMEAVAYFAGARFSDHPPCVSLVIGAFLRSWNDAMNDEDRQTLKPYVLRVMNTAATPAIERHRSYMALDWYCRVSAPAWLRCAGLEDAAKSVEAVPPIVDSASAKVARAALNKASESAARSAARSAAESAAESAAWSAARSAQREYFNYLVNEQFS